MNNHDRMARALAYAYEGPGHVTERLNPIGEFKGAGPSILVRGLSEWSVNLNRDVDTATASPAEVPVNALTSSAIVEGLLLALQDPQDVWG